MIILKNVTRLYRRADPAQIAAQAGVKDVSASIPRGDFALLKGVSGSGKTTLLSLIGGLERPDSGTVILDGIALEQANAKQLDYCRRRKVGFVFQSFNLLPTLNVLENTALPAILDRRPEHMANAEAQKLLSWLGLEHRLKNTPDQLSGGEMQRTAIARALINNPQVILADEPTGNLDSANGNAIIDMLFDLRDRHDATLILVTHAPELAQRCDRVITLSDGRVIPATDSAA